MKRISMAVALAATLAGCAETGLNTTGAASQQNALSGRDVAAGAGALYLVGAIAMLAFASGAVNNID